MKSVLSLTGKERRAEKSSSLARVEDLTKQRSWKKANLQPAPFSRPQQCCNWHHSQFLKGSWQCFNQHQSQVLQRPLAMLQPAPFSSLSKAAVNASTGTILKTEGHSFKGCQQCKKFFCWQQSLAIDDKNRLHS